MTVANQNQTPDWVLIAIVLASVVYNAILAVINANVMPLGFAHVAICEFAILGSALLYIIHKGIYPDDIAPTLYLLFTLVITLYLCVVNGGVIIDFFRNILIIYCFVLLGSWANMRTVRLAFIIGCVLVLIFLFQEMFLLKAYEDLFNPMAYYENTRGLKQVSYGGSKLFQNALGFPGRFTFGIMGHRASSLFLEQLSLANFAGVILIFTVSFWSVLPRLERLFYVIVIGLAVTTTDSRTMLIFSAVCFAGYFIFPLLPSRATLLVMPVVLVAGLIVYILKPDAVGDTLDGRVVLTMKWIEKTDMVSILGLSAREASKFADSGYVYIVYAGTIFSLIAMWLFVGLYPAANTPNQKRCTFSFSILVYMILMVGGTPIFSVKIAGALWFMIGFMKYVDNPRRLPQAADAALPSAVGSG